MFIRMGIAFIQLTTIPLTFFRLTINVYQFTKLTKKQKTKEEKHAHQAHWHRLSADILWVARDYRRSLVCCTGPFRYHLFKLFLLLVSALSLWLLFISCACVRVWTVYYLILASSLSHRPSSDIFLAENRLEIVEIGSTFKNVSIYLYRRKCFRLNLMITSTLCRSFSSEMYKPLGAPHTNTQIIIFGYIIFNMDKTEFWKLPFIQFCRQSQAVKLID